MSATPVAAQVGVKSCDELVDLIKRSQLMDDYRLNEVLGELYELGIGDPTTMAQELIKRKHLTRFQAKLLLTGKWRGFILAGKYRLLDQIGAGGMGKVYLCEHLRMQRMVAVKVLPYRRAQDPTAKERFDREARAVASLNHPNIVQAYDIDEQESVHYLVMEFVDGASLQMMVARHGPMQQLRVAHYLAQAAEGLQHAYEMGLIHRDIKPANLLLNRDGTIKILDYGLARFFDHRADDFTRQQDGNAILGTADYAAPEQALDSHQADIRTDIYSLGATAYFLFTGEPPFGKEANPATKLIYHQIRDPEPISNFRKDIDPAFLEVMQRMMTKKPERRYQTPQELLIALQPFIVEPIPAPTMDEIPAHEALSYRTTVGVGPTSRLNSPSTTSNRRSSIDTPPSLLGPSMPIIQTQRTFPGWAWLLVGAMLGSTVTFIVTNWLKS